MRTWRSAPVWRAARYAVVDVETTGLDPRRDAVLSVGVVPIDAGRIAAGATSYVEVRHDAGLRASNVLVHGLTPSVVAGGVPEQEAARVVGAAIAGRIPVAHFAGVERAFLLPLLARYGVRVPERFLDTEALLRLLDGRREDRWRPPAVPLAEAAGRFRLPVHRPHHALGDALTTAQLFLALATALEADGVGTPAAMRRQCRLLRLMEGGGGRRR